MTVRSSHVLVLLAAALVLAGCGTRRNGPAPVEYRGPGGNAVNPAQPARSATGVPVAESYIVQRGDTVYSLSRKFDVPVRGLIDANGLQPPYQLIIGQRMSVPRQRTHEVATGETLYSISRRYGVDMSALVKENDIPPPYAIRTGQRLTLPATITTGGELASTNVPPASGVAASGVVTPLPQPARQGSVESAPLSPPAPLPPPVAASPSAPQPVIAAPAPVIAPAPAASSPSPLAQGTAPAAQPAAPQPIAPVAPPPTPKPAPSAVAAPPAATAEASRPEAAPQPTETAPVPGAGEPATPLPSAVPAKPEAPAAAAAAAAPKREVAAAAAPPPPRAGREFLWPVRGRLIATFGSQGKGLHNDGINILAAKGTAVRAAENGVVAYAGNEIRGFGNLLLIRHADGYMSAYAHNDVLLVQRGDTVRRGQTIAKVGATGNVSQPQLHFEIRKGSQAVDPEQLLGDPSVSSSDDGHARRPDLG